MQVVSLVNLRLFPFRLKEPPVDRNEKRASVARFRQQGAYSPESQVKLIDAIKSLVIVLLEVTGSDSDEIEACRASGGDVLHWVGILKQFVGVM